MLRVVGWNINGIRSPLQGMLYKEPSNCAAMAMGHILDKLDADIVCLQETKLLAVIEVYNSYFSFSRNRSGYSEGLSGLLATHNGDVGCYGNMEEFTQEELWALDSEGQALLTQHKIQTWGECLGGSVVEHLPLAQDVIPEHGKKKTLTLINVYCSHADAGKPERLTFKMCFYRLLQIQAEALLAAGINLECFEEDPRCKWMDSLLSNLGCQAGSHVQPFIDSYRCFQPNGAHHLNYGSRFDYVLRDRTLVIDTFQDSFLLPEVMGSDHCPVGAVLSVSSVPAKQCPPLCTHYLPEFAGTQLKILCFLVHHKQDPVFKQSVLQLSKQTQVQMHQNKAHVCSTRLRLSQTGSSRGQKNLTSYFQPFSNHPQASPNLELPSVGALMTPKTPEEEVMAKVVEGQVSASEAKDEKEVWTSFWKSLLGGPLPMPLCGGHREPCVMQTVKKPGHNLGCHFYMCARPQDPPTDPSSHCNFFLWSRPS
ncbi:unnamed protein product [Nyctereutes procyonoides]|uniref:(raccoon dog) hypothetical protein n=1 Tax=Nyctereutes procyonoides TaxID=34880 RepID=A0A811Z086_NYCPR|nr:unnamed protein product [Nyctereutes procyonoides]